MKKIIIAFLSLPLFLFADVVGRVSDAKGEPLIGVNVYWLGTTTGVATDTNGDFSITKAPKQDLLVFSSVSYAGDTIRVSNPSQKLQVTLKDAIELSELNVVRQNLAVVKSRTSVFQTEKITGNELLRAACCNLSESFETNPSVDVAYSDAATGAKQIRLLGLSGNYVQMLTENIPNLRGISSAYGLNFIPGSWMDNIQVSKGTASVINGYEAITGQINVEYKKPRESEDVALNIFMSDAGRGEFNLTSSLLLNNHLSTALFLHTSDEFIDNDKNDDDFLDLPKTRQYNVANRWFYQKGAYLSQFFVRGLHEYRRGGQIDGNYKIGIKTQRYEFFTKNGYVFNPAQETSIGFIFSGSLHEQNARYGNKSYDGTQQNLYANLIFQTNVNDNHKIVSGLSSNLDVYEELLFDNKNIPISQKEFVSGAFLEYTFKLKDKVVFLGGIRGDYSSYFKRFFISPRFHMKYDATDYLHLRASVGKGYRSPHIWAENNYLLAGSREIKNYDPTTAKMEEAWNYGLSAQIDVPVFNRNLNLSGEWYYTQFLQQTVADIDTNPHEVIFYNSDGQKSYSNTLQIEADMELVRGLSLTLAHRITDVKTTINNQLREKPLTSRYKSLMTVSYKTKLKKWQFDFTTQLNGGGRLPDLDKAAPLWEKEFKPYAIMNVQATKYFRTWSLYAGVENLAGFMQKNPIIDAKNPFGKNFDATMIWGPTHGRKFYIGLRWALERENRKPIFKYKKSVLDNIEKLYL